MKVYTVFHFNAIRRVREQVGIVLERREQERGNNFEGLMKVARKFYPPPSPDTLVTLEMAWLRILGRQRPPAQTRKELQKPPAPV